MDLNKKFGDKIKFIGVNVAVNEKIEGVRDYIKSNGINFPNIFDKDKKIIRAFGVMGTPIHIIIDRKGVIKYRDSELPEDLGKHIKELLN